MLERRALLSAEQLRGHLRAVRTVRGGDAHRWVLEPSGEPGGVSWLSRGRRAWAKPGGCARSRCDGGGTPELTDVGRGLLASGHQTTQRSRV